MKEHHFLFPFLVVAVAALTAVWAAPPLSGQTPARSGSPAAVPRYDTSTEATLKGSVEAVKQISGPKGWGGTHVTLKTEKETIDVHVGPSWYLAQKQINFAKGEQIEVIGSRVKFGDSDALIAREIKKGEQTLTLRNAQGIPLWSRGRRRPR
jgi:hypothetical protein